MSIDQQVVSVPPNKPGTTASTRPRPVPPRPGKGRVAGRPAPPRPGIGRTARRVKRTAKATSPTKVPAGVRRTPTPEPSAEGEPLFTFKRALRVLIVLFTLLVTALMLAGGPYYASPMHERVFHPLHNLLKPSGLVGHWLGIMGTFMMLLIFVYSLRKRSKLLQKIGNQAQWLQAHVFLGLAGPILVTFHTTGKLGGIVAVAFYSMWAIVISGVFGRYLYAKIPRTLQGNKMTLKDIEEQLAQLVEAVHSSEKKEDVLKGIEQFLARSRQEKGGLIKALVRLMVDDVRFPMNAWRVWSIVGWDRSLTIGKRSRLSRLVLKQRRILEKLAVLDASQRLFSYWHVFHRPFTVMMLVIAAIHVSVALYLGFIPTW